MKPGRSPSIRLLAALALAVLVVLVAPRTLSAQEASETPGSFERTYIDAGAYRGAQTLLHDWPELTRLVVGARRLEAAVSQADQTLSAELLAEFRSRVDSLRAQAPPPFLGARADSVRAALDGLARALAAADASLAAMPEAQVTPQEGAASADAARQRTLVTGSTAVTVPAGVAVGSARDSLPSVTFEEGESLTFVDRVALALVELDRVVHLTRTAGAEASPAPSEPGATPAPDSRPPRPGP
jgi:hypothetical protein